MISLRQISCLFALLLTLPVFGQSLSGSLSEKGASELKYGTVNVYQGKKMVASVLTDATGHFKVALDTGVYRVEFQYVGHEPLVKTIHITGDEKGEFNLIKEEGYAPPALVTRSEAPMRSGGKTMRTSTTMRDRLMEAPAAKSDIVHPIVPTGYSENAASGMLTAGEVNDFTKWDRWTGQVNDKIGTYKDTWKMFVDQRYTVQLKNQAGTPVVDAEVQLLDKNDKVQFIGRTDNTGKVELWGKIGLNDQGIEKGKAIVLYQNKTYILRKLQLFRDGINTLTLDVPCSVSSNVDIAFVVDATGSMGDEIAYLKEDLQHVIFQTKNAFPNWAFRFANIFYRDRGDAYLTKRQPFTNVLSASIDFIKRQNAGGGGDRPESPEVALNEALDSLKWSKTARARILFLVLDAPPHQTPEILSSLQDIVRKAAAQGVCIVPIAASGTDKATEYLLRTIALVSNGTYTFLTNDSGIGRSHIEPTTDNYKVESLNALLIRVINTFSFVPKCSDSSDFDKIDVRTTPDSLIALKWKVWPNPTQDKFQVKLSVDIPELYITDLTGKILLRYHDVSKRAPITVNLSEFPKGIYLIAFEYNDEKYVKKVMKI